MKTKKISLPIIIVSIVAFMMIATGIASWIITISKDFSLEYSKEGEIVSGLDCSSVVYDGNGHLPLLKDDAGVNFKDPDVFSKYKFEFRKKGEFKWNPVVFDTAYVPSAVVGSAPIDAGDYEIRYTDPSNFSCIVDFTIDKATPTVNNVATLGTTIYGNLPVITQPTSTPATYVIYNGSTEDVAGSFTFLDEESTKFNSTVRNYTGESTTTSASTKLLFVPTSSNYNSVEVDATFTAEAVAYCSTTYYCSIEKALEANTSSGTIFVIPGKNPGVYENCSVASGVTLTIPYSGELFDELTSGNSGYARDKSGYKKSEVTIFENITLSVLGILNVGGIRTGGGGNQMAGQTALDYTQINLLAGAVISCSGTINCYGYIIGTYETNNESKVSMTSTGTIQMPFVVEEHRGGSMFVDMAHVSLGGPNLKTSPFNRFHFNNVESLITFEFGSKMVGLADLYASSSHNTTSIALIGPNNDSTTYMIEMESNTYVEARYVHSTQIIDLDIYGGFSLNPLKIAIKYITTITLSTEDVYLPVSWYYDISLNRFKNGTAATCSLTAQKIKLLPGAKLEINEGVTVNSGEITIFENIPVDTTGCPTYPTTYPTGTLKGKDIPGASITLNGTLNISKIGGLVLTEVEGAKLNVTSASSVSSKELVAAGPTYETKTEYLNVYLYTSNGISEDPSIVAIGNYESKADSKGKCGWLVDPINLSYDINVGAGAIVYKENITIKNSSGAVIGYNLTSSDLPSSVISNPTRENYEFVGWGLDPSINPDDWSSPIGQTVYANTVFYAIWKPISYTITYDLNVFEGFDEGTNPSVNIDTTTNEYQKQYTVEDVIKLPTPEYSNYIFAGWYLDKECTERVNNSINPGTVSGNITIYGKWNPAGTKVYYIKFIVITTDNTEVDGSFIELAETTQSCFSLDGVSFSVKGYIETLAILNNKSDSDIYYSTLYYGDKDPTKGTYILGNSITITDQITTPLTVDSNGVESRDRVLTFYVKSYNKIKITYKVSTNYTNIANAIPSNATNLPTGTNMHIIEKYSSFGTDETLWFIEGSENSGSFYRGGTVSTISNNITLSGVRYRKVKLTITQSNSTISIKSISGTLVLNTNFNSTTISCPDATGTQYFLAVNTKIDFSVAAANGYKEPVANPSSLVISTSQNEYTVTASATEDGGGCVTGDTLVTLANGSKVRIDSLTGNETLLVWNHYQGTFEYAKITHIEKHNDEIINRKVIKLTYSNGNAIKIVIEHIFFDATLNKYVAINENNVYDFIGHSYLIYDTNKLSEVVLTDVEIYFEDCGIYELITDKYAICFTNDILSGPIFCDKLMNRFEFSKGEYIYDNNLIALDIEKYGLYEYKDFEHLISQELFDAIQAQHFKVVVEKRLMTWEELIELILYLEELIIGK